MAPHRNDIAIAGHVPAPIVAPDVEMVADTRRDQIAPDSPLDEKHGITAVEDIKDAVYDDPNSPEAILNRYPLLRNMSESELEKLNHRVRRRM
jgi:hypothetical protein